MKKYLYFFLFSLLIISGRLSFAQDTQDAVAPSDQTISLDQITTPFKYNSAVLFDNGPLVTLPGGGCASGDASILNNTNGSHSLYGWGFQKNLFNWMADDFTSTVPWNIDSLKFYAYQTSATSSTINGIYIQIWNGAPNAGGTVVWGDTVTNRLQRTGLTNMYRALISTPTDCARRLQEIVATVNTTLPPGNYWVQFAATGTSTSGPWCPPVTISGQLITGNAIQKTPTNPNWAPALNGDPPAGSPNGAPFIVYGSESGGIYSFYDNFDSYTAGQRLACQNPTEWTTWSNAPCAVGEDALVSNLYSSTSPNSVVITKDIDQIRLHGDLTTGKWYTGFHMYIPTGKAGYWNMLSAFTFNTGGYWAFECYFDVGGGGRLQTGTGITNFTWQPNTWQWVEMVIDLDLDVAQFWMGGSVSGTLVHQWAWTNGSSSGLGPKIIDATDFFGATANDQMYIDNFFIGPASLTPVELTSFGANVNAAGQVVLNWTTATEINNQMFEIERSSENGEFYLIGHIKGHGTTSEPKEYSYIDMSVVPGKYYYRLKQVDFSGVYEYSNIVEVEISAPLVYNLAQNYPNPFNPSTQINFSIAEPTMIKLAIYNLLGQEIQVLRDEFMQPGLYQVSFNASNLPSGMYIYKLETANYVQARKMMIMK
jgi:hypothetical protein